MLNRHVASQSAADMQFSKSVTRVTATPIWDSSVAVLTARQLFPGSSPDADFVVQQAVGAQRALVAGAAAEALGRRARPAPAGRHRAAPCARRQETATTQAQT